MASSASDRPALPRVGLPACIEHARWGVWDRTAALLPYSYVAAVAGAGGLPGCCRRRSSRPNVVCSGASGPENETTFDCVARARRRRRPGADRRGDVEPARYGAEPLATTQQAQPERDAWEVALALGALDRDLPLLAICRGTQVLNVALGGTLDQHALATVGHTGHQPGGGVLGSTPVRLAPGSPVAAVLGDEVKVPCYHHQAIARLGRGVQAVGWADDGVIEAAVVSGHRFALAVQWHPEDGDDPRLFQALTAAATTPAPAPPTPPRTQPTPPSLPTPPTLPGAP